MYTITAKSDHFELYYNDNGPELSSIVTHEEISKFNAAKMDQVDPETCIELKCWFAANDDYDAAPFTILKDEDANCYFDELVAIEVVGCFLRKYEE